MDFDQRLKKAMERGRRRGDVEAQAARAKSLGTEELKRLHSPLRLQLSEHIEQCVERLSHHFPGFTYETIFGERGWGAACSRDDLRLARLLADIGGVELQAVAGSGSGHSCLQSRIILRQLASSKARA